MMDAYHVLAEDEGSFLVHQNGSQFRVAKKGLSDDLQGRLRSRSVQKMAFGGDAPKLPEQSTVIDDLMPPQTVDPTAGTQAPPLDPAYYPAPELTPGNAYAFQAGGAPAAALATAEHEEAVAPQPPPMPKQEALTPPPPVASGESASAAPRVAPSSWVASKPKGPDAFDLAGEKERQAIEEKTKNEIAKANAQQAMLDDQAKKEADIEARRQTWHKQNDDQIDGLQKWLGDPKNQVDANRWWSNKSTASKVTASISILLGGLAQGIMKGGRNQALDIIDQQIQRDIDEQKENINNKKSLVASFMNQGHSVDSAAEMARASMLSITRAKIAAQANQFTAPEQQAQAKSALAELDLKIQGAKQAAAAQQAQLDHARASTRLLNAKIAAAGQPQAPVYDKAAVNAAVQSEHAKKDFDALLDGYDHTAILNTDERREHEALRQADKMSWVSMMTQGKPGPKAAQWADYYDKMIPESEGLNRHVSGEEIRKRRKQMQKQAMALGLAGANARAAQKKKGGGAAREMDDEEGED